MSQPRNGCLKVLPLSLYGVPNGNAASNKHLEDEATGPAIKVCDGGEMTDGLNVLGDHG